MRRLWIASALLAALLAWSLWEGRFVNELIEGYAQTLSQARQLADAGRWDEALEATDLTFRDWQSHELCLYSQLHHDEADAVLLSFREVEEYLLLEEMDQYAAANAKLIAQLKLLGEMEQPKLENVL